MGNDPVVDDEGYTYRRLQVDPDVDYEWNYNQIQKHLKSGILQGKSAQGIANDFFKVMQNNRTAAIRNARTAITSAQNSGRQMCYSEAASLGIKVMKRWSATFDERTRESHAELDGVTVPWDKDFPNGLKYPGDSAGMPAEVYNCRCTMVPIIPGINDEEWVSAVPGHEGVHTPETYVKWLGQKDDNFAMPGAFEAPKTWKKKFFPSSIRKDLKEVNKNFIGTNTRNCVNCVVTYEMRRRGYNVTATNTVIATSKIRSLTLSGKTEILKSIQTNRSKTRLSTMLNLTEKVQG